MIINNFKNETFFKWITNNNCNYNCSYCFEKHFQKKEINLIPTAKKIDAFMNNNNLSSLILLGGEFFLLDEKDIINILEILANKKRNLYIITNFSLNNSLYERIFLFVMNKYKKVEYKFSFHDEYISIENFFKKVENFLIKCKCKIKLQFTLTQKTEFLLSKFLDNVEILKKKGYLVSEHIEKAYSFNKDRTEVYTSNINSKVDKLFSINGKKISSNDLFKNGPLDNFGAKCYQPFFHLENNILYSHCYGRIITKDFENYIPEKINYHFICNRHSCLIYKSSIIEKI